LEGNRGGIIEYNVDVSLKGLRKSMKHFSPGNGALVGIETSHLTITNIQFLFGARGGVVVKALCYKPEGRGFETR
jgi:hypothetical protein